MTQGIWSTAKGLRYAIFSAPWPLCKDAKAQQEKRRILIFYSKACQITGFAQISEGQAKSRPLHVQQARRLEAMLQAIEKRAVQAGFSRFFGFFALKTGAL
jgi:hypothetical protein